MDPINKEINHIFTKVSQIKREFSKTVFSVFLQTFAPIYTTYIQHTH